MRIGNWELRIGQIFLVLRRTVNAAAALRPPAGKTMAMTMLIGKGFHKNPSSLKKSQPAKQLVLPKENQ